MKSLLRILHLEDNPRDSELVQSILEAANIECDITRVDTFSDYYSSINQGSFDIILADNAIPSFSSVEALSMAREKYPDIPFIFVSGTIGEEGSIESDQGGATDYVLKERISRLIPVVQRALHEVEERRKRKCAEEKFRLLVESLPNSLILVNKDGIISFINSLTEKMFGYKKQELIGHSVEILIPQRFCDKHVQFRNNFLSQHSSIMLGIESDLLGRRKDGREFPVEIGLNPIKSDGETQILCTISDTTKRKQSEDAVRKSEEKYRLLFEDSKDVIFMSTPEGKLLDINPAGVELFGYSSKEELLKIDLTNDLYNTPMDREKLRGILEEHGYAKNFECTLKRKDGEKITALETASVIYDKKGKIIAYRGILRDITGLRHLEEQLHQSQRIESIGRLASGIAHDFNNLITIIRGYCEILSQRLNEDDPLFICAKQIDKTSKHAESLINQLLTFSRAQVSRAVVLNLNDLIQEMEKLFQPLTQKDIELQISLENDIGNIKADPSQIEQVIMNLFVNACDAMPNGGRLSIESKNVIVDDIYFKNRPGWEPGSYVVLAISDTGIGMDKKTQAHIFEPFYTTKEKSKGTGLGLSTVYGIVKQSGGNIWVYSEPGKGTIFRIYFPQVNEEISITERIQKPDTNLTGTETILVVEDEQDVRFLVRESLQMFGYNVLETDDGNIALQMCKQSNGKIHLLLTDVMMPRMAGRQLYDQLRISNPDIKVLFMSGYTENAVIQQVEFEPGMPFIQKPFTPKALALKVRQIFDKHLIDGVKL